MSFQSAPAEEASAHAALAPYYSSNFPSRPGVSRGPMKYPCYLFICFFECGQGHRGPMITYCPGGP
ncbi:unnamed protein product, partial [Staurois parvus]